MKSKLFLSLLIFTLLFLFYPEKVSAQARCAPKGSPLCLLRKGCPTTSDRSSQCCDTLAQCDEPIKQVRCAPSGSVLCAHRTNCPGDSNYAGYCCDNINQCYNTTAKGPESSPGITCGTDNKGVNTALGCIPTDPAGFVSTILTFAIGIGGGIALILILVGFFIITTSGGIPDKVNAGKELITAAISGLLFIIFSAVLLNLIGVQILNIPGL